MNRKSIYVKILSALVCATFLYGCSSKSATQSATTATTKAAIASISKTSVLGNKEISAVIDENVTYESEDNYSDWKNGSPNYIELSGTSAELKGSGADINNNVITITKAGIYVISGKLDNGQIIVNEESKGTVRLVLNGAEISSNDNAPIYVKNAGKTVISLEDGTENVITDGSKYALADATSDEPSAAIFSKSDLTVNGTGKLTVQANYKDGIVSKDDLKIISGNIQIKSVDDGLIGRDLVAVKDGTINIEAGGDGIKATNDTDTSKGLVTIQGGTFNIKSGADGIQAETYVLIADGKFDILAGGGNTKGAVHADNNKMGGFGKRDNGSSSVANPTTNTTTNSDTTKSQSKKGIKAGGEIVIGGGTVNIDSADDAIHGSNLVTITAGDISVASGDDGAHADAVLAIKGGKLNVTKSYEGLEGVEIDILGGEINVNASDDGVNAGGGTDSSSTIGGGQGANPNNILNITGGNLIVNSIGDGLDSNGSMYMTGGTAVVSGPTENMNAPIDYNGTFEMSGGFLIAAGSSGMAQATSDSSTQNSVMMYYSQTQKAGTIVSLKDSKGNTIATYAPEKDYQSVVISSPEIKKNSTYTIYTGGTSTGNEVSGFYTDGENKNGTKIVEFKISNSVTYVDESGVTTAKSSGFGGPGGAGGHGGKGGRGFDKNQAPDDFDPNQAPPQGDAQ